MRVALDPELGDESIKRALAGPFRLVRGSADRVVIERPGLTVVFRRLEPYAALQAFRRGELDEAPVPQGEIRALEAHPTLGPPSEPARCGGSTSSCCLGVSPGPAPCLPADGAPRRVPGSDQRARGRACATGYGWALSRQALPMPARRAARSAACRPAR